MTTKQEWDGGGLPPVGCECEMLHPGIEAYGWQKVIIKAHFDDRVAIKGSEYIWDNSGYAAIKVDDELQFRPIRTQAEREREEVVFKAADLISAEFRTLGSAEAIAEHLYDAGMLRKERTQ